MTGKSPSGFSLIELILVIALVAVMLGVAVVAIYGVASTYKLNSAASKVISDLRYTSNMARTKNGWFGVRFQANPTNQYNVYSTDGTTDTDVDDPANLPNDLVVNVSAMFKGVTISAVNFDGGDKVEFNPFGVPYTDKNASPISAAGTVTLSLGGSSKVIQIIKNTGRVEIQ